MKRSRRQSEERIEKRTTYDGILYIRAVKFTFQDDKAIYDQFLHVLTDFKTRTSDRTAVIARVKDLFAGHRDLILGFNTFLPGGCQITLPPEDEPVPVNKLVEFEAATLPFGHSARNSISHSEDRSPPLPTMKHMNVDMTPSALHIDRDLGCDRADKEQGRRSVRLKKKREERGSRDHCETSYPNQPKSGRRRENTDNYGTHKVSSSSSIQINEFKSIYSKEFALCEKIKDRLCPTDGYRDFLKLLYTYSRGIITRSELKNLVSDLLDAHPDLIEGFNEFLAYCDRDIDQDGEGDDKDNGRNVENRERDQSDNKDVTGQKTSLSNNDKYIGKPNHELDLSNCESVTPSYRLLPKDYPIPLCSYRTQIGAEVLNDHWVSVSSGSDDYSSKDMCQNPYEEILFQCEDDRFEMDLLLESVNATILLVEDLLEKINGNAITADCPIGVEEHFKALDLRCVERIYGGHGLDFMDVLKKNAPLALPVLLTRLKQKQEEWTRCRVEFNKVWAEIYTKNYYEAIDHRRAYFKHQDSRNLSEKA